jgi:nucleoside-diphosphate-sugar epimerase
MSRAALVTGSAGFVGRHMARALEDRGYHVLGCDIVDGWDARQLFRLDDRRFDLVVHCAAVVGGRTMIDGEPLRLAAEDLSIDAEMFRWALRTRPGRIVAFSSSAAYPVIYQQNGGPLPLHSLSERCIGDDIVRAPDQTYGWVKLTLERLAAEANAEGIPTHVFRPFSGYGADQALDYPFPAIVKRALGHRAVENLLGGRQPFEIWGDPASARDWVHIDDVVGCVLAHIDADARGPVNICTGLATTFATLVRLTFAALGQACPNILGNPNKPSGVFWRVGDPTLMRQVYEPKVTLEEGIARAIEALR